MIMLNSFLVNGIVARFAAVPVIGDFEPPKYYFGQCLWHCVDSLAAGKAFYPVTVLGMSWTGLDWQYHVELPEYHPHFKPEDHETDWVDSDVLKNMDF